ncbi:MAG: GNAT family N-acetyltransferase [Chloroflexota bacterium]
MIELVRLTTENTIILDDLAELNRQFAIEDGQQTPSEPFCDYIVARLDDEAMFVTLAVENGTPIGYILVFDVITHPFIPDWHRSGYITQMFVHADHRRKGIGRKLVDDGLAWLTVRGVSQVMLNVHVVNPNGQQFWQSMGFVPHLSRKIRKLAAG